MNAARLLIAEAAREGASFRLEGERLRLVPAPGESLSALLVEKAKAEREAIIAELSRPATARSFARPEKTVETWEERAAHLEFDAGFPRAWAEHLAKLIVADPPGDFSPTRWQAALDGALAFADQWAVEAHRLGWSVSEVFGLHPTAPAARVDCRGLAWLLGDGSQIVAMARSGAEIRTRSGGRHQFYRPRQTEEQT